MSQNVTINQGHVNMSCKADAGALFFIIDGQSSDFVQSMGFIQGDPIPEDETIVRRMLTIILKEEMAGRTFKIFCQSFKYGNLTTPVDSETALLMVAGMLNLLSVYL